MKKRLLSLALSFVMLLTMLPVSVWAEMADNRISFTGWDTLPPVTASEDESGDELLLGYLYEQAGLTEKPAPVVNDPYHASSPAMMGVARGTAMTGLDKAAYDAAKTMAAQVADGSASDAVVTVTDTAEYTAEQVGVEAFTNENWTSDLLENIYKELYSAEVSLDLDAVQNALISDLPYDLYWYDKTEGVSAGISYGGIPTSSTQVTLTVKYHLYFTVAESYANGSIQVGTNTYRCVVNTAKTSAAKQAAVTARGVVDFYSDRQDYEKLQSYLTYVNGQVSYNSDALNTGTPYGDPWQLIYVFDGDPDTNVVCEGYAKAFKFLCDLSTWSDTSFSCILATGKMGGGIGEGDHMWNIVHIRDANNPNGGNFLVDPTNCDENMVGRDYGLFLKGNSTSEYVERTNENTGNSYNSLTYTFTFDNDQSIFFGYDDDTQALYDIDELTLAAQDYVEPVIDQSTGLRYRVVTDFEWVDDGESGYNLAQVDAETRSELTFIAGRGLDVQIGFINSDGTFTALGINDVQVSGGVSLRDDDVRDKDDQPCLWVTGTSDGAITYQVGGETYTLPVAVTLPDVGFYSEAQPDKGHYIEELVFNNDPKQDVAYLFWPTDATLISVEKQEWCTVDYEIQNETTMAEDGYAKILLKSFGDGYVNLIVNYQQGDKPSNDNASLSLQMGAIGLGYRYLGVNWDSNTYYTRENVYNDLLLTASSDSYIQVVFYDGEDYIPVSLEDLQFNGIEARIVQNNDTYLYVKPEGANDGSISYQVDDITYYTLPVTVQLPDVGYYSSSSATKETFLSSFDYKGDNNMVYLVWPEDVTRISVEKTEWCTAEYEIQNEATMAENHYAAISLHISGDSRLSLHVSLSYPNMEGATDDSFNLTIRDMSPGLRLVSTWDNVTNQPAANATVWARFTMQPQGARRIQLAFFDGERYQLLTPEDVTTTNVTLFPREDGYLMLEASGIDDGTISYPKDNNIYTMEIPVQLPDVWYYSSPVASKDTYLNNWVYDGTDKTETIYLVATNGYKITESPTLLDGSRAAKCTLSEDGTYATIQLTGAQDDLTEFLRLSASLRKGNVQDPRSLHFVVYYSNLTANIELPEDIQGTGYLMSAILRDKDGQPVDGVKRTGMDSNRWLFNYTQPGDYLLEIAWDGCVTRTVPITVEEGKAASVSVALLQRGNVNAADGTNVFDMQCLFEYLSLGRINSGLVTDENDSAQVEYFLQVADVNGDSLVNILDYQTLYELLKPNEMTA